MQNLSCENVFYYHANKTYFHNKGFAFGLVLRVRVFETRKWPTLEQNWFCNRMFKFLTAPVI